jgi:hypothetical protein
MPWYFRYFPQFKFDKAGEGSGGGGGGGGSGGSSQGGQGGQGSQGGEGGQGGGAPDYKSMYEGLAKKFEDFEKKFTTPPDNKDLSEKLKQQRLEEDKKNGDVKKLEAALRFEMQAADWLKTNEKLLPKGIAGILELASKESYDSPVEKDASIKAGIIKEFFSVQENVDLLTASQKAGLEEFLKLTKNAKQERAQSIYDSIFEPTFENLKRMEKAKQVNQGIRDEKNYESEYKKRLIEGSRKQYLGDKK